ncbi:unnamed protein product, partial [Laminaria digitata]
MLGLAESNLGEGVVEPVAELLHGDSKAQAVKVLEMFQHDADLPKWQAQVSGRSAGRRGQSGSRSSSAPTSGNGRNANSISSGGGDGG